MSATHGTLSMLAAAAPAPPKPAGGASEEDIGVASGAAAFAILFVLMGGLGHRGGLVPTLGWFERFSERVSGQPAWASLPCGLAIISLIASLFGLYWDVALHVDVGRDEGPFGTPAHYFILAGLYGIFAAGFFAICLGREERADRPGPTAIRIAEGWYAPLGGVLIMVSGGFSLISFPLDDQWHRLFGQDVTLWGPTHLMLIGGAVMALLGIAVIQAEVRRAMKSTGEPDTELLWVKGLRHIWWPGGVLIGLTTFQLEFDLGVPQFQLVFHPMLIMLAAGVTLVAARVWLGPGRAFAAVIFYLVMRGGLTLIVGPSGLGESVTHFPLYIVEAAIVEGVALLVSTKRPLVFGAVCGALLGTVGLAAEWGWSHVWMPIPWPREILGETIALGLATALAASLVGAWIGARLGSERIPHSRALRYAALTSTLALAAMLAVPLFTAPTTDLRAAVALRDLDSGPQRTVAATVKLDPAGAADDAKWLTATSWQGGGLVVDRLRRTGPGTYVTTKPIPVYGEWKSMIRLHTGNALVALPLYAPDDPAIPVKGIGAPARFERPFFSDKELLQREARTADPAVTWGAYGAVLLITIGLLAMIGWGIHRVGATADTRQRPGDLPPGWSDDDAQSPAAEPERQPEPMYAGFPASL